MTTSVPASGLQLRSLIGADGQLEVSLVYVTTVEPKPEEVLVRIEAAPLNPSDLGLLFGPADLMTIKASGTASRPVVTATVPEALLRTIVGRVDQSLPVGNEGGGIVVAAGSSEAAQALLGRTVGVLGLRGGREDKLQVALLYRPGLGIPSYGG